MKTSLFSPAEKAATDKAIARSLEELRRVETVVEALVDVGAFSPATLYAQVAATRAWLAHTGVFVSPAIEHALARAAARITVDVALGPHHASSEQPQVLHVATQIPFPEGGHGRLLERWIRSDTEHTHSLAMTQPGHDVPEFLRATIAASGGTTHGLAPHSSSFVERARHLRTLASGFDAIVLHTHPNDALPILALSYPGRPPTIVCNHAPHVFWLGRSVCDVVTYGREFAKTICTTRRGIPPDACFPLPVALDPPDEAAAAARSEIRRELDVADNDLLLLTVGGDYKLRVAGVHDFVGTMANVVARRSHTQWRIVGPPLQ